ncbi:polysaccharide deacetylase family protein [Undibacterium sp. SXout7W]|uniref:polysaccharide deacetylase family protein n=1 Tax=Undibacterium sp. SXout7W TaxID=3413049 RepID=UPI003BF2D19A
MPEICKLPMVASGFRRLVPSFPLLLGIACSPSVASAATAAAVQCQGHIYLTFDTGSQSQTELIASVLRRHQIKATFFLANEKTVRDDYSLDASWGSYWKTLANEGHAFGSHTFDHVYAMRDLPDGRIEVRPQFGAQAGQKLTWTAGQYCEELRRVDQRFLQLTGKKLDPYWRAPGGKLTPNLQKAGESCGYRHVAWAAAGFSGDELSSEKFSNPMLLKRALTGLRDGDIFMAHLGIWSRKQAWAPENLEPLISGLEQKGYCFATLREHPSYRVAQ